MDELSPSAQLGVVEQLRRAMRDEDSAKIRRQILDMLRNLLNKPWITKLTDSEIRKVLHVEDPGPRQQNIDRADKQNAERSKPPPTRTPASASDGSQAPRPYTPAAAPAMSRVPYAPQSYGAQNHGAQKVNAPDVAASTNRTVPGTSATKNSTLPSILGVVVILVAITLFVLGFWTPGFFVTKVLDDSALQAGITKILTQNYNIANVSSISCPQNIKVTQDATFTCSAVADSKQVTVPVRFTSNEGGYEVGRPS